MVPHDPTTMLTEQNLPALQKTLAEADVDGWLLFDFQRTNPIANGLLKLEGMMSRRVFAWIPRDGTPHALQHAIEPNTFRNWPASWDRTVYSSWRDLEAGVAKMVKGKRIAMEYSPGDAVPYLDRVPAGVLDMVRNAGAVEIVCSGELVTKFHAVWTEGDKTSHVRSAELIARIAHEAFALAGERARTTTPIAEHELMQWIQGEFAKAGVQTDHGPNVSASENAANPHYEPTAEHPRYITEGDTLLIDLWAQEQDAIYADQTWMASIGEPSRRAQEIWNAIRDARDAAIHLVTREVASGRPIRGGDVDDVARKVIEDRGFGQYFTHRTGHSIDARSLHGSGPHLDNLETREERLLVPGVGFSIEPGIYIPGEIGMRTEVNVYVEPGRAVVTPAKIQRELIVV